MKQERLHKYDAGLRINIHFARLMGATLELRDSFGKLMTDGCLGQTPRLSCFPVFFFLQKIKFFYSCPVDFLPMKVEPVESFGFAEGVYRKLHQLVVAQVQGTEGC